MCVSSPHLVFLALYSSLHSIGTTFAPSSRKQQTLADRCLQFGALSLCYEQQYLYPLVVSFFSHTIQQQHACCVSSCLLQSRLGVSCVDAHNSKSNPTCLMHLNLVRLMLVECVDGVRFPSRYIHTYSNTTINNAKMSRTTKECGIEQLVIVVELADLSILGCSQQANSNRSQDLALTHAIMLPRGPCDAFKSFVSCVAAETKRSCREYCLRRTRKRRARSSDRGEKL